MALATPPDLSDTDLPVQPLARTYPRGLFIELHEHVWGHGALHWWRRVGPNRSRRCRRSVIRRCSCAAMLDPFDQFFDQDLLPLPQGLFESPLSEGVERYAEVVRGGGDKVIFVP